MQHVPVYILAGGRSSRFGSDKARALLDGRSLIQRIAAAVSPVADFVTAVADQPGKYDGLGVRTIGDDESHLGPLGGLVTALHHRRRVRPAAHGWLLLCACDLVDVKADWIRDLWDHRDGPCDAVAFKSDRWEPLLGLYHDHSLEAACAFLASGRRTMGAFLDETHAVGVPLPNDWPAIAQINTREDLERARMLLSEIRACCSASTSAGSPPARNLS